MHESIRLISYACCLGQSTVISAKNSLFLQMCISAWNRERFTKKPPFWISRSFKDHRCW